MGLTAARDPRLQSSARADLPADSDWEQRELLIDVQAEAAQLQYGVGLDGPGIIWIDEFGPAGGEPPATGLR